MNELTPQTDEERAEFAARLRRHVSVAFDGSKFAAYTSAGVSSGTWQRLEEGLPVKAHTVARVLNKFWPEAEGDWRKVTIPTDGRRENGAFDLSSLSDEDLLTELQRRRGASSGRALRRDQDEAAQAADPDGPEGGA